MTHARIVYTATSSNKKTGDIPHAWVGETLDECYKSCEGCALRPKNKPGRKKNKNSKLPDCYAFGGTPLLGVQSIHRAIANGKSERYTLRHAIDHSARRARFVRMTGIGDIARADRHQLAEDEKTIRAEGMGILGYTHFWEENPELAGRFLASCDNVEDADRAIARGWRTAVVLPTDHEADTFTTPAGHEGIVCPAIRRPGMITCNECGLCDAALDAKHIGFPDHGPGVSKAARAKMHRTGPRRLPMAR